MNVDADRWSDIGVSICVRSRKAPLFLRRVLITHTNVHIVKGSRQVSL